MKINELSLIDTRIVCKLDEALFYGILIAVEVYHTLNSTETRYVVATTSPDGTTNTLKLKREDLALSKSEMMKFW